MSSDSKQVVTWLGVDGWHALYVDGKLVGEQGHSLSPWTYMKAFEALGATVEDLRYEDVSEEVIEENDRFPDTWPPKDD
jgi:hypothetical protein